MNLDIPGINSVNGATYGNNVFVIVGDAGAIFTSIDGNIWDKKDSGTTKNPHYFLIIEKKNFFSQIIFT